MHDPHTLIRDFGPIQLWHEDPCKDGTDDSCGWFKRARHGDKEILKSISRDYIFEWCSSYQPWFTETGDPALSTAGITIQMFHLAAWHHFKRNRRKVDRFMRRRLYDILYFAENSTDTMATYIQGRFEDDKRPKEERAERCASIVYGCVIRWSQHWWQHPRWHIHHWRLNMPILHRMRRCMKRCVSCNARIGLSCGVCNEGGERYRCAKCTSASIV